MGESQFCLPLMDCICLTYIDRNSCFFGPILLSFACFLCKNIEAHAGIN